MIPGMKLLAVDTTSRAGSVALLDGSELRGLVGFAKAPGHAETLLPTIDTLLQGCEVELSEVEAFAVVTGPGSFTGLRIGISTVEGLAYSTRRPVVGVSSLEANAHRYRFRSGWVAPFLDARRGEVFGALYRSDGKGLETVVDPVCEAPERFLARLPSEPPILFAGSGLHAFGELLSSTMGERLLLGEPNAFLAEDVARIGLARHQEGKQAPLGGLRAIYLRPSDAEKARAEPHRAQK
jgi:tRNA threonylcarbamoyladenosine biosynthesis protein TsaB